MSLETLLSVSIDFDTSHTVFPTIVAIVLGILLAAILATRSRAILATIGSTPWWPAKIDHMRFFGTLAGTVLYFIAMPWVGDFYPNTGLGFYICSIPYLFAMSVLYLNQRDKRHLLIAGLNALIAPSVVWYLLSELFNISLP